MTEHTCTPPEALSLEQDDWCCPTCATWWRTDEEYCYECGRGGPVEWRKGWAHLQGPDREDGSHYLHEPPPFEMWDLIDLSVSRGGFTFGAAPVPVQPPSSWVERDAKIKAGYARRLERAQVTEVHTDSTGLVASGGWCAPRETLYDLGQL